MASGRPGKSGGDVPVRWSWRWEREGLEKFRWVVSEERLREMNFFGRVSEAREVVIKKMMGRPPTNRLCCHLHRGRMGIWKRVKYLYFVGEKFCHWNEILNLATVQV